MEYLIIFGVFVVCVLANIALGAKATSSSRDELNRGDIDPYNKKLNYFDDADKFYDYRYSDNNIDD